MENATHQETFDRLARLHGATLSRRAALGALAATGLAPALGDAEAKNRRRRGARRAKGKAVTAQATCASPGPSSNLNGCSFNNQDLAGIDLSSSSMRGTKFRGANLCGANLSSSQLRDADFRGFASPANATNLFLADLSASGCNGTLFNARTLFCQTTTCNGTISNRDCPQGVDPADICCTSADCGFGQECLLGQCGGLEATSIGVTEVTADGGVRLISDFTGAEVCGGLEFRVGAAFDFSELTRLEAVYNSERAPGCRTSARIPNVGSPRFELGTIEGDIYVSFAPENDCVTGPNETGNLIGNNDFALYDTSRIPGGSVFATYSETRALLQTRELAVHRVALVADGGVSSNPQRVVVRPRVEVTRGGSA